MVYQPKAEKHFRVTWYGGESTQLHFEKYRSVSGWYDRDVRTLGGGVPSSIKELLHEMEEFYNDTIVLEQERLMQRM